MDSGVPVEDSVYQKDYYYKYSYSKAYFECIAFHF